MNRIGFLIYVVCCGPSFIHPVYKCWTLNNTISAIWCSMPCRANIRVWSNHDALTSSVTAVSSRRRCQWRKNTVSFSLFLWPILDVYLGFWAHCLREKRLRARRGRKKTRQSSDKRNPHCFDGLLPLLYVKIVRSIFRNCQRIVSIHYHFVWSSSPLRIVIGVIWDIWANTSRVNGHPRRLFEFFAPCRSISGWEFCLVFVHFSANFSFFFPLVFVFVTL